MRSRGCCGAISFPRYEELVRWVRPPRTPDQLREAILALIDDAAGDGALDAAYQKQRAAQAAERAARGGGGAPAEEDDDGVGDNAALKFFALLDKDGSESLTRLEVTAGMNRVGLGMQVSRVLCCFPTPVQWVTYHDLSRSPVSKIKCAMSLCR